MCMCIQEGLQGVSLVPRPSWWIVKVGGVANVETATGEGVTGAGRKAEAKRVNGLYTLHQVRQNSGVHSCVC